MFIPTKLFVDYKVSVVFKPFLDGPSFSLVLVYYVRVIIFLYRLSSLKAKSYRRSVLLNRVLIGRLILIKSVLVWR